MNFNSIKVRLELLLIHPFISIFNFNSIKVRLEQYARDSLDARVDYFNSIKVRLELAGDLSSSSSTSLFQFHKGAIRTYLAMQGDGTIGYFNSIKVRLELTIFDNGMNPQDYFNSIKVRLELLMVRICSFQMLNFNSIKVRLEPDAPALSEIGCFGFQFHKGAIRTANKIRSIISMLISIP